MPRFDITIAGELNVDLILYGLPEHLEPERELLADRMMFTVGSSSAIVAHNLAALGSRVGFQSRIGTDHLGDFLLQRLSEQGVDTSRVRRVSGATQTGMTVILHHDRWRNILTYPGTIAELTLADLDVHYLADSSHFHFSSIYLQTGLRPSVIELFRELKAAGLTISLDTNDDPADQWSSLDDVLKYVDVFFPNEREARKIARTDDLEQAVQRLSSMVPLLVVKLGPRGALAQQGDRQFTSPPVPVKPVDAVGAGDSFNAGFLSQFVRGASILACLAGGNLAGALSTTRPGGTEAFRDREYREQFLEDHAAPATS